MLRQQRIPSPAAFAMALVVGLGALLLGRGLAVPGAHAQENGKRVVVVPFEGSGGGKIADTTAEILKAAGYTVVSDSEYRDAARKLDARGQDSAEVAKVAAELQLTAVIFGEIDKGASRLVKVKIHAGANGAEVAAVEFEVKRRKLTPEEEELVRTRLLPALANVTGAPPPPPRPQGGGETEIEIEGEGGGETEGTGTEGTGGATTTGGSPVQQADDTEVAFARNPISRSRDTDEGEDEGKAGSSLAGNAGLELSAGVSFTSRILRSEVLVDDVEGPTYDGPPAPALFLGVEAYPAAFASETLPARFVLANIGLQLQFERVFGLTSEVTFDVDGGTSSEVLDTTQMRLRGGLVYRLRFGDDGTAPVLKLGVGYERFQFALDRSPLPGNAIVTLPDTTYASVDPGLVFRYPVNDQLAVSARARLLLILDAGDIANMDQYGDTTSSMGFDVGLDVEYLVMERLAVRLGARFMDVTVGFEGNGMLSNNLDGNPATKDVEGITDYYLGALLTAGYLF